MAKMKSRRATQKRFKVTGSGKLKRMKAFKSHILTKKSEKRKRNLRTATTASSADERRMKKAMGM